MGALDCSDIPRGFVELLFERHFCSGLRQRSLLRGLPTEELWNLLGDLNITDRWSLLKKEGISSSHHRQQRGSVSPKRSGFAVDLICHQ